MTTFSAESIEVTATPTQLNLFIPSGLDGKYTEWRFRRYIDAAKHVDKWLLNLVYSVRRNGDFSYTRQFGGNSIVSDSSTWEHAVQVQGDADFSGGIAHGWEKYTAVTFLADGIPWTPATGNFKCRNFEVTQQCDLFRWKANSGDPEDIIAKTTEMFEFSARGLALRQSIRFQASLTLQVAYLGMLPIIRSITGPPAYQITSWATRNNDGTPEDISVSGFTQKFTSGSTKVQLWGPAVTADWEQTLSSGSEALTFISNSPAYNKLYRQQVTPVTGVTSSTVWETAHRIRFST